MRLTLFELFPLFVPLALFGCSAPPEAPAEFEEIGGFLYQFFTDDPEILAPGVANMEAWLESNLDAKVDPKSTEEIETVRDGYTVQSLPLAVLASVRPDVDPEAEDSIAGSAVATQSMFDVERIALALSLDEQEEVFPESFVSHDRTYVEGLDCFADRSCTFLDTENLVDASYAAGALTVKTDSRSQYRWVQYGEEGSEQWAMLNRTWLQADPEIGGAFGPLVTIHEQLYLGVILPWEGGAVTVGTTWVSASVVDINENFALNQMINAMQNNGVALDKYLAAQ